MISQNHHFQVQNFLTKKSSQESFAILYRCKQISQILHTQFFNSQNHHFRFLKGEPSSILLRGAQVSIPNIPINITWHDFSKSSFSGSKYSSTKNLPFPKSFHKKENLPSRELSPILHGYHGAQISISSIRVNILTWHDFPKSPFSGSKFSSTKIFTKNLPFPKSFHKKENLPSRELSPILRSADKYLKYSSEYSYVARFLRRIESMDRKNGPPWWVKLNAFTGSGDVSGDTELTSLRENGPRPRKPPPNHPSSLSLSLSLARSLILRPLIRRGILKRQSGGYATDCISRWLAGLVYPCVTSEINALAGVPPLFRRSQTTFLLLRIVWHEWARISDGWW